MPRDWCVATQRAWATVRSMSTCGLPCSNDTPAWSARSIAASTVAVERRVFDGIASVSVQEPPRPVSSISVTSAPSTAAALAAA